jgi:hypothetical protein
LLSTPFVQVQADGPNRFFMESFHASFACHRIDQSGDYWDAPRYPRTIEGFNLLVHQEGHATKEMLNLSGMRQTDRRAKARP